MPSYLGSTVSQLTSTTDSTLASITNDMRIARASFHPISTHATIRTMTPKASEPHTSTAERRFQGLPSAAPSSSSRSSSLLSLSSTASACLRAGAAIAPIATVARLAGFDW